MFRIVAKELLDRISSKENKILILLGARQVGKTTVLKNTFPKALYINLEKSDYIEIFNSRDTKKIDDLLKQEGSNSNILILDEAQRLKDPGLSAKVIFDEMPEVKLILSGSSSLELANRAGESLAGREHTIKMFPLTLSEWLVQKGLLDSVNKTVFNINASKDSRFQAEIKDCLKYGLYPQTLNIENKEEYLLDLVDNSILKDVYYLNLVKNTKNILSLLRLLAYQVGQQVNYSDLSTRIGISRSTVSDYIEILKKTFVIFTLSPYTRKRRDEIGKTEKVYFYDLGIRNAIINDFTPVEYRKDFGNIFENFVISEIIKLNSYYLQRYKAYYWRTKWGSEVDLILSKDNLETAIEIKIRGGSVNSAFLNTYPNAKSVVLDFDNIGNFLIG